MRLVETKGKTLGSVLEQAYAKTHIGSIGSGVIDNLDCSKMELTSLEGGPAIIERRFLCDSNKLTSLVGGPKKVGSDYICSNNPITTLEGAPEYVECDFCLADGKLTSLKDIHKHLKFIGARIFLNGNPIKSHVLGVLKIKGLQEVSFTAGFNNSQTVTSRIGEVETIINRYLDDFYDRITSKEILACQSELLDAGYEEFAQL
jgi:hypothetical protein